MCETPYWRFEPQPLPPYLINNYTCRVIDHSVKDAQWLSYYVWLVRKESEKWNYLEIFVIKLTVGAVQQVVVWLRFQLPSLSIYWGNSIIGKIKVQACTIFRVVYADWATVFFWLRQCTPKFQSPITSCLLEKLTSFAWVAPSSPIFA